jgi:hypothetical protein
MTLYLDGSQPVEKASTAQVREAARMKALDHLSTSLETFETRMEADLRIRKQHFISIRKNLGSAFYWSLASRQHFAEYMERCRLDCYTLQYGGGYFYCPGCPARRHCNLLRQRYDSLHICPNTLRPVSHDLLLVYSMSDVLKTIEFTRNQFTALAIVSRNDYQRNIYSLGPASNYSIIKAIGHRPGTALSRMIYLEPFTTSLC